MALSCTRCSANLPFDGAPCPDCGTPGPAVEFFLGSGERSPISEELLDHLRSVTAGEFKILREIGHGGMARVYLAHEIALDRQVALKVLSPLFTEYPEIVKRFQHEARTAGQLSHPHIAPVFAVYQGDGLSFFTMPFVKGSSFRELIHNEGPLDVEEAIEFIRQAASGLAYAHEHGVVHRDVKPENIMLDEVTGRVVLTDFGLAKALGAEPLTLPGDMIGTPHYMAPEQCDGDKDVDGRSDQYALALVAYEMLAGEYPFDVDGFRELLHHQLNEYPEPLENRRSEVPPHVAAAIHKALSKNPKGRFKTIDEFAWALSGEDAKKPSSAIRRRVSHVSGVYEAKTLWVRDRLARFHQRERLKKWRWPAGLSAAAAILLYLGVAAVSGDGASANRIDPGDGSIESALSFIDVDPLADADYEFAGPPAELGPKTAGDTTEPGAAGAGRAAQPSGSPPTSRPRQQPTTSRDDRRRAAEDNGGTASQANAENSSSRNDQESATNPGGESPPAGSSTTATIAAPEAALEIYRAALEREDMAELGRIYGGEVPETDSRMLSQIFDNAEGLQVEMEVRDVSLEGDRAVVEVDYPMEYVLERTKRAQKFTLKLRVSLELGRDGWRIVELERR